jgi:dephospho-CoA kinase
MPKRKIIAILGLPGSGKTEAIDYLIKRHNWPKVYFGEVTFDEMKKRGLEINEKNEREVREGLRKEFGLLYYAQKTIEKIEKLPADKNVLVESLYSWAEYLEFKKKFSDDFMTIAVYASPKIRYERLGQRPVRPLTPADCQSRDYAQIENLTQANAIAMADYTVINERTRDDLYCHIDKIVNNSIG